MITPEDVINRFINEENVKFNQERDDWMIEAMEEYAKLYHESKVKKLNIPAVMPSLEEDATTCIICGEFEPHCKCKDGYKRHFLAEQHELLLAKNCYISDVVNQACGDCIYYLTCNSESRDKQICDNYDNEP